MHRRERCEPRRFSSADPEYFVFAVDRVHENAVFAQQSVITAPEGGPCALEVSPGAGAFVLARSRT